jgi:PAS domain-containing protein
VEVTVYSLVLWAASAVSAVTAVAAWRIRKRFPGGTAFSAMMIGVVIWCLMAGTEASAIGSTAKIFLAKAGYLGVCSVIPLFVLFGFSYGGRKPFSPAVVAALWIIPVTTLFLVTTNEWHSLVWTAFTRDPVSAHNLLRYSHGPWYWVWTVYCGVSTISATAVLVRSAQLSQRVYLRQSLILVTVVALPWAGELLYLLPGNPFPGLDIVSVGFALSGGFLFLGMQRFRLFDLVPVRRADLVERISEGLVVIDSGRRVVDINPAARSILGVGAHSLGRPAAEIFAGIPDILSCLQAGERETRRRITVATDPPRSLDISVMPLRKGEAGSGRVLVVRESTAFDGVPAMDPSPAADSADASESVSTDSLVSVCASCEQVRDDSGNWISLAHYVKARWRVQFSHGLCDPCISKLYPEVDMDRDRRKA